MKIEKSSKISGCLIFILLLLLAFAIVFISSYRIDRNFDVESGKIQTATYSFFGTISANVSDTILNV